MCNINDASDHSTDITIESEFYFFKLVIHAGSQFISDRES